MFKQIKSLAVVLHKNKHNDETNIFGFIQTAYYTIQ